MQKKKILAFTGISALGAAVVLLSGCGGSSFSKSTFGNYPNSLPYTYGLEPVAFYGQANNAGIQAAIEGSGLQAASGGQAYITGASAFTVITGSGAVLPGTVDPNGTGSLPLGFSTNGQYVDAANQTGLPIAPVTGVAPGTSVVFRAALTNGVANNNAAGITSAVLTSTDAELASVPGLTAGLPMTLDVVGGAFSNATYATGAGGTATPFTIPASTSSGLHTAIVTVTDDAGRSTATTFIFPVVASTDVALFLQSITVIVPATTTAGVTTPATTTTTAIAPGDTVTIDGGAGIGTYPTGYASTTADAQGTVVFFVTPGTHTVTETDPKGVVVQTETFTLDATTAGTTLTAPPTPDGTPAEASARPLIIHPAAKRALKH